MNCQKQHDLFYKNNINHCFLLTSVLFIVNAIMLSNTCFAQNRNMNIVSDENILSQYIQSKGKEIIVFDSSNIKQFWIDDSVVGKDNSIEILLIEGKEHPTESKAFKIQLANVNASQNCIIDIIAETDDFSCVILDDKSKVLATTETEEKFIDYCIQKSLFHLEDTKNFSFFIKFFTKHSQVISIKKIILSFSKNESYLSSPRTIVCSKDYFDNNKIEWRTSHTFALTGERSILTCKNKLLLSDKPVKTALKVTNIGDQATSFSFGYKCISETGEWINNKNYPYNNNNKIAKVISGVKGSNKIIIDKYLEWSKDCYLCIDAKEDMSDIPNVSFADGKIVDIVKLDDNRAEITLDKPNSSGIKTGTNVRVHGKSGAYLYAYSKTLNPGEECLISSEIQKDETLLQYTSKAFSRGVFCVVPIILSYSTDPSKENTILVEEFTTSY